MPDEVVVDVRGLTKKFGGRTILDSVDVQIARGEVVSLIGPSGAGKSTLLRCLNYLETPTSGTLSIAGERFAGPRPPSHAELRALRLKVGMVFQNFNLFPHRTALKNIVLPQVHSKGRSVARATDRARELLALVGMADKADRYPSRLSGGEQQRVAIARALALPRGYLLFRSAYPSPTSLCPRWRAYECATTSCAPCTTSLSLLPASPMPIFLPSKPG